MEERDKEPTAGSRACLLSHGRSGVFGAAGGARRTSAGELCPLDNTDPGFEADGCLHPWCCRRRSVIPIPSNERLFYRTMLDAVRALPGVESAGTMDALPFSGENHGGFVQRQWRANVGAEIDVIGGEYLQPWASSWPRAAGSGGKR